MLLCKILFTEADRYKNKLTQMIGSLVSHTDIAWVNQTFLHIKGAWVKATSIVLTPQPASLNMAKQRKEPALQLFVTPQDTFTPENPMAEHCSNLGDSAHNVP